ncbi:hypothetical protein VNI00_014505 [Paramarasmius palmivorus]|uniref:Uncharacterized protein n=1 Tax=Paramarasmius palmivorus TaxID=297713 RepID=A0AAW0BS03_9AGAR
MPAQELASNPPAACKRKEIICSSNDHDVHPNKVRVVGSAFWSRQANELSDAVDALLNHDNETVAKTQKKFTETWRELQKARSLASSLLTKLKATEKILADQQNLRVEAYTQTETIASTSTSVSTQTTSNVPTTQVLYTRDENTAIDESQGVGTSVSTSDPTRDVQVAGATDNEQGPEAARAPLESGMSTSEKKKQLSGQIDDNTLPSSNTNDICSSATNQEPVWFQMASKYLRDADLGTKYVELVNEWEKLEADSGWKSNNGMVSTCRPKEIDQWRTAVGRAERFTLVKEPKLQTQEKLEFFGESVWQWWCAMQPQWRVIVDGRTQPFQQFGREWHTLNRRGPNGLVLLLVTVKWWGCGIRAVKEVQRQATLQAHWHRAIEDMLVMLRGLSKHLQQ